MTALSLIDDRHAEMIAGGWDLVNTGSIELGFSFDVDIAQTNELDVKTYAFGFGSGLIANGVTVGSTQVNTLF